MNKEATMMVKLLFLVSLAVVACFPTTNSAADPKDTLNLDTIPLTRRVEGRVTLEYVDGEQKVENKLTFSEVADATTGRSKISIGHISYEPKVYYTRGPTVLTLNSLDKKCEMPINNKILPELDYFLGYSYTEEELERDLLAYKSARCHSPVAILLMHINKPAQYQSDTSHRGVTCSIYQPASYTRSKSDQPIKFEIFVPKMTLVDQSKPSPIFTVRETVQGLTKPNGLAKFGTIITIDFFYIESIDKTDQHQLARLEEELNLPLARGCSVHLQPVKPQVPNAQSFMMSFVKGSTNGFHTLAYDHEFGYLREEQSGHSVKIWDLNEDLLYHLDRSMYGRLRGDIQTTEEVTLEPCSVIVLDKRQTPSVVQDYPLGYKYIARPYDNERSSLDVLEFMGAKVIYYMGQSTVRDMPCLIFETWLTEPPMIFQVDIELYGEEYDFIAQYYVFKSTTNMDELTKVGEGNSEWTDKPLNGFWPARINLYARHKKTYWVHLHESLDVSDFHWGLYGWQGKPSELFMMPECFDNEDEQLKIELALEFKNMTPTKRASLLAHHKYQLEMDLQSKLFQYFKMSRLHLTEYRLTLQRHNLLANFVISDRKGEKKLSFFGECAPLAEQTYKGHKTELVPDEAYTSVESCIMTASHISTISMVIYCPIKPWPTCTAVFSESEPEVTLVNPVNSGTRPNQTICQVYRFEPGNLPKPATHDVELFNKELSNFKFMLQFEDVTSGTKPEESEKEDVEILVQDFDVTREQQQIIISNYVFTYSEEITSEEPSSGSSEASQKQEKKPETAAAAEAAVVVDSSCKSFSYCPDKEKAPEGRQCLVSSLDLRGNNVEDQLVHATVDENKQVVILDQWSHMTPNKTAGPYAYKFSLKSGCNIHERDWMSTFTRTEEVLRVNAALASQLPQTTSATICARRLLSEEENDPGVNHVAAFAYCAHTGTCLSDEAMFGEMKGVSSGSLADEEDATKAPNELTCAMYRRRYQAYFHVSGMVIKRGMMLVVETTANNEPIHLSGGIRQLELGLNTVEECARACWDSFGHVCVSFDFCSPGRCLLNTIADPDGSSSAAERYNPDAIEYEYRDGCLNYKRDLRWDQLRREHLIGKHNLLVADPSTKAAKKSGHGWFGSLFLNLLLVCTVIVLFDVGLIIGRNLNDRWDIVSVGEIRRTRATESTRNLADYFGNSLGGSVRGRGGGGSNGTTTRHIQSHTSAERLSDQSKFNIENEIYEDASAIRLEEFGTNRNGRGSATPPSTSSNEHPSGPGLEAGGNSSNAMTINEQDDDLLAIRDETRRDDERPAPSSTIHSVVTSRSASASKQPANYIDVPDLL